MKAVSLRENITEILATISAIGSFTFLILLLFKAVPQENKDLVNVLGGLVLGNTLSNAYGYYFGQSKKRDIIPEAGQSTTITQKSITEEVPPVEEPQVKLQK